MNIFNDKNNSFFSQQAIALKNAITVNDGINSYYYEFEIRKNEAIIKASNYTYIEEAVDFFRSYNRNITVYKAIDDSFYKQFDYVYTFKLPIKVLQPSTFFLCREKLDELEQYIDEENIAIPVTIIDEEYVIVDGHHRVKFLEENYAKMVTVYLDAMPSHLHDLVYIAKEQNITSIKNLEVLSQEEYDKFIETIMKNFN